MSCENLMKKSIRILQIISKKIKGLKLFIIDNSQYACIFFFKLLINFNFNNSKYF